MDSQTGSGGSSMRENAKKARSAAATVERAKTETGIKQTSTSKTDSTTSTAGCLQISDFLLHGAENAAPRRYLETVTGLDGRTIRELITRERLKGTPILSDCVHGYYLPANENEKARFVRSMRRRAGEILRVAEAVEKTGAVD